MYKLFFSLFLYLIIINYSLGQSNVITYAEADEIKSIGNNIFYLEDMTSQFISTPTNAIDSKDSFKKNDGDVLNFANTQSAFWFRFEIQKATDKDIYLEIKK